MELLVGEFNLGKPENKDDYFEWEIKFSNFKLI
jgi:hypothetical protein